MISKGGKNPTFYKQYASFNFCFVLRFSYPGGENNRLVVGGVSDGVKM